MKEHGINQNLFHVDLGVMHFKNKIYKAAIFWIGEYNPYIQWFPLNTVDTSGRKINRIRIKALLESYLRNLRISFSFQTLKKCIS